MTRNEWRKQARERKLAKLEDKLCERARAKRDRESTRGKYIHSHTPMKTRTRNLHIEVRATLQTERVETKQVQRDRETLQDFITKTDAVWLVAALRNK